MSKPVVVIVPGAWMRPAHYQKLNDGLAKFQYESVGVTLPSVDSKPPLTSWDKDAEAAREVIMKSLDADKDVIVIAHSYGGMVMSEAVKGLGKKAREEHRLKTGVMRLIYMCAIAPQEGQSLQSLTAPTTEAEVQSAMRQMQAIKIEEDGTMVPQDSSTARDMLYNRCDPADADEAIKLIGTHPAGTLVVPATYTAYREIPSTYILTQNDAALPPTMQERMIAQSDGALEVVRCEEGHSPFLSDPGLVVDVIRRAAGEQVQE